MSIKVKFSEPFSKNRPQILYYMSHSQLKIPLRFFLEYSLKPTNLEFFAVGKLRTQFAEAWQN